MIQDPPPPIHLGQQVIYWTSRCIYNLPLLLQVMERRGVQGSRGKVLVGSQRQSCDEYRIAKVLPHIKEEFHYRVENRLMVEKIVHPRRDKTIVDSLANTTSKSFFRRKQRRRDQTSVDHRRKLAVTGFIKRQLRPQTCQLQSHLPHCEPSGDQLMEGMGHCDQKQCSSTLPERFQLASETPKCRWMLTDCNYLREASVGRIVKNTFGNHAHSQKQTANATNRCVKVQNSVTLPCEPVKDGREREGRGVMMEQYLRMTPSDVKKLERRAYQHFHNKENLPLSQKA